MPADRMSRRAVDVLKGVGTPAARALLGEWADADPAGERGRAASAALTRLKTAGD